MSERDDGLQPAAMVDVPGWGHYGVVMLNLRDYFAGQALVGFLAHDGGAETSPKVYSRDAYEYADAMIAARKEPRP